MKTMQLATRWLGGNSGLSSCLGNREGSRNRIVCACPAAKGVTKTLVRTWQHLAAGLVMAFVFSGAAAPFVGSIRAVSGPPVKPDELLYTVGSNYMRVEVTDTNRLHAINVVDLGSGQVTLIRPMNRTYVRFTPGQQKAFVPPPHAQHPSRTTRSHLPPSRPMSGIGPTNFPGMPARPMRPEELPPGIGPKTHAAETRPAAPNMPDMPMPPGGLPPGIGPQARADNLPSASVRPAMPAMPTPPGGLPPGIGPQAGGSSMRSMPGMPAMPVMPAMPMMAPEERLELKATGQQTNLFGYDCQGYELKQHGQTLEIWATDQLLPFQNYLQNEPRRFGPQIIKQQWGRLLDAKKLFPLRAVLRMGNGMERYRFEVRAITPRKLTAKETAGFEVPEGYIQLQPRPF